MWITKLAELELDVRDDQGPVAAAQLDIPLPGLPSDVMERLLICRQASVEEDKATIDRARLAMAFPEQDIDQILVSLERAGLIVIDNKASGVTSFLGLKTPAPGQESQIRLAADWWQQFLRLHVANKQRP